MPVSDTPRDWRVGCCGFPISLRRYAEEFSVVEVQQTFYQPPRFALSRSGGARRRLALNSL